MEYKFRKDPLFGKYCYIDTPWIAGKNTIYRIVNSGVRSNAWVEVPINGLTKKVNHGELIEDIVFVMLDTLIDEDTEIIGVALKDIEIIGVAEHTENSSEIPNNCKDEPQIEYCDTCRFEDYSSSKEPCNSCLVDGSKWQPKDEPTISKMEQVDKPKICDTCRYYNSNIPCGSTPSACKKADKFAEEFVDGLKKLKTKDEPKTERSE